MTSKKSGTRKSRPPAKRNTQNRNESTSKPVRKSIPKLIRQDATRVEMFNSGLEVWIYDDKNAEKIRKKQLWQKLVDQKSTDGHLIGYSLRQDDSLCIDVVLGKPLTEKELAAARWLTPQQAFS